MKCFKCGKKAFGVYSFDIDLPSFGFCKKHKDEVYVDLIVNTYFADAFKKKKRTNRRNEHGNRKKS